MTDTWQSRLKSAEIITPSKHTWSQAESFGAKLFGWTIITELRYVVP